MLLNGLLDRRPDLDAALHYRFLLHAAEAGLDTAHGCLCVFFFRFDHRSGQLRRGISKSRRHNDIQRVDFACNSGQSQPQMAARLPEGSEKSVKKKIFLSEIFDLVATVTS